MTDYDNQPIVSEANKLVEEAEAYEALRGQYGCTFCRFVFHPISPYLIEEILCPFCSRALTKL